MTSVWWLESSYQGTLGERTLSVISRAAGGDALHERLGQLGLAGGALALDVGDIAAGAGDGSDKAGNLELISTSIWKCA